MKPDSPSPLNPDESSSLPPARELAEPTWDLQTWETGPAWEAFVKFRDAGPSRTLALFSPRAKADLARALGKKEGEPADEGGKPKKPARSWAPNYIRNWWRENFWVERARAWDRHVDRERREKHLETVREMQSRHADTAYTIQAKALAALEKVKLKPEDAKTVLAWLLAGMGEERKAVGVPEKIVEQRHGLADDEAAQGVGSSTADLNELARKLEAMGKILQSTDIPDEPEESDEDDDNEEE